MGLLSMFNPELLTNHMVTITPILEPKVLGRESIVPDLTGIPSENTKRERSVSSPMVAHNAGYDISWPRIKGAKFYRLYGSVSPERRNNLLQDGIESEGTEFYPPWFSEVVVYFFWVSAVFSDGSEKYIEDTPSSLMVQNEINAFAPDVLTKTCKMPGTKKLNCEMKKITSYIRTMDRLQLELNGEPAFLYLRRSGGDKPYSMPCSCTDQDSDDTDYQGTGRCLKCFGTGVYGGFYPRIPIAIRYGNAPEQIYKHTKRGLELDHGFNTYMMWTPTVRVGDIIVRAVDGSRYTVERTKPDISVRGVRLHQEFDLRQIENKDILMQVTDESIENAISKSLLPQNVKAGFKIFG